MPRLSEGIYNFLQARKTPNNADLIERWEIGMETQINVAADNGEPVDGKRSTYTDGEYEWFNIRVPKNAAGEPEFRDYELRCPLDLHTEGIGMTGWHWATRRSKWVAFDFDSLTAHAKGIGVSDDELERVKQAAMAWPGAEIRKSTGGAGIHIYTFLDDIPTENHTVHAALARCILGMMSSETGFDFASQIDCCGGNMWIHHRKMTIENDGLKIIKPAEKVLSLADLPSNWRDHIEVVTRRRAKVRVHAELKDEYLDPFEALTSARRVVPLDDTHKAIIDELANSGFSTIWVPDHHLCQTHTCALEKLMEKKGKELSLQGIFKTTSDGKHPETPNCFMFPLDHGGWRVYRFSPGVAEDETWSQDKEGWTQCYFNRAITLRTAARWFGGQEDPDWGGYVFGSTTEAIRATGALGQKIALPESLADRTAHLKAHKDGRLVMRIGKKSGEKDKTLDGWITRENAWVKLFDILAKPRQEDFAIPYLSCAQLDSGRYELEYLVDGLLVAGQPCILGGAKKALKTTILIALAVSLATGKPFLGQFAVKRACRVAILSGESGLGVIQETARRICRSLGVRLADIPNLIWSTSIPRLDKIKHLDALDRFIKETHSEIVAIDPAYLALGGADAGNVFSQGERLRRANMVCERNNASLILAHHTTRTSERQGKHRPPELDDLAWAGFPEWARQWLLLGRRESYVPGTGEHPLWLNVGGSAGHSSLWAVDVDEGVPGKPRHWKATVSTPEEVREKKESPTRRERILNAAKQFPDGESKSVIMAAAKVTLTKKVSQYFDTLVKNGEFVQCEVKKRGCNCLGYRLATHLAESRTVQLPA